MNEYLNITDLNCIEMGYRVNIIALPYCVNRKAMMWVGTTFWSGSLRGIVAVVILSDKGTGLLTEQCFKWLVIKFAIKLFDPGTMYEQCRLWKWGEIN